MEQIKKIAISRDGKKYFIRDTTKDYHTKEGFIRKEELKKTSSIARTNTGSELYIFNPKFIDLYNKIKRLPQIIPLKDIGAIIANTGINKKSYVLDAGSGSGALSLFLSNIVKRVVTYEIRDDFIKIVRHNIQLLKIKNLNVEKKDIYLGIDEKNLDLITLDVPKPWEVLAHAEKSLKLGGFLVSYSPTIVQVSDLVNSVKNCKTLLHIKTMETLEREWEIEERRVRPKSRMLGHSGFLTFIRKISA